MDEGKKKNITFAANLIMVGKSGMGKYVTI